MPRCCSSWIVPALEWNTAKTTCPPAKNLICLKCSSKSILGWLRAKWSRYMLQQRRFSRLANFSALFALQQKMATLGMMFRWSTSEIQCSVWLRDVKPKIHCKIEVSAQPCATYTIKVRILVIPKSQTHTKWLSPPTVTVNKGKYYHRLNKVKIYTCICTNRPRLQRASLLY